MICGLDFGMWNVGMVCRMILGLCSKKAKTYHVGSNQLANMLASTQPRSCRVSAAIEDVISYLSENASFGKTLPPVALVFF